MTTRIILAGPRGRMGSEAIKMIQATEDFSLIACLDREVTAANESKINEIAGEKIPLYEKTDVCFQETEADVFIDLTVPDAGYIHTKEALSHGVAAVVGTSGFSDKQLEELSQLATKQQTGCIIAPNFALGAVLMMHFSKMAAKYFPDVEIIEKHHDQKLDAPSGTAKKTVEVIKENRVKKMQGHPHEYESEKGARGANMDGIHLHSMRLPGLVAHQEVVFGSNAELLTIKHDSFHRESFMQGLKLAVEKVLDTDGLVYGLEHVMEL